jgi:glycosyltransferase involved in cell wall biosynthesis
MRPRNDVPGSVIRVVHVTTRFLGSGAERSIAAAIDGLPGPNVEHVLVVGRDHDLDSIRELCGEIRVIVAHHLIRRPDPIRDPLAFIQLVRIIRRTDPGLVHTIESKAGILGRAAARFAMVPAVVHTVNMANFGPGFSPVMSALYRRLERLASRWTDAYVVNGTELRQRYVDAGIAKDRDFTLIRSAVDVAGFQEAAQAGSMSVRQALGVPIDRPTVLFAGALDRRKGAYLLPEYLSQLQAALPGAYLVVAGRGPLREEIELGLDRRGLSPSVRWLGFTDRLPEAVAAADCLIMLSRAEGLATVLLHAAAAGTPFVSYQVDGPAEIIGLGARGAVVPLGNLNEAVRLTVEMIRAGRGKPLQLDEWAPEEVRRRYGEVLRGLLRRDLRRDH